MVAFRSFRRYALCLNMYGSRKIRTLLVRAAAPARKSASTLIELLVVVSIIGFLMSILLPSLKRSMELAYATSCKANLRHIGQGTLLYTLENSGWLPVPSKEEQRAPMSEVQASSQSGGSPVVDHEATGEAAWFGKLFPTYLGDPMVLRCPKDPFGFRMVTAKSRISDPSAANSASYGMNSFILTAGDGYLANIERHGPSRPLDTILLADAGPDRLWREDYSNVGFVQGPERNQSMLSWGDRFDPFSYGQRRSWVTQRHGHGIHAVTLDGGVRSVGTTEVLRRRVQKYYRRCAAGGCTMCNELEVFHYSFAADRLFWWTGPVPTR